MKYVSDKIYRCSCGSVIDEEDVLSGWINPIKFDYLVKQCVECKSKYITPNKYEFFNVNKLIFIPTLLLNTFRWGILFAILTSWIQPQIWQYIMLLYLVLHIIIFSLCWNKELNKSKKRINNKEYLTDLLQYNLIDMHKIKKLYREGYISKEIYNSLLIKETIID